MDIVQVLYVLVLASCLVGATKATNSSNRKFWILTFFFEVGLLLCRELVWPWLIALMSLDYMMSQLGDLIATIVSFALLLMIALSWERRAA